MSVLDDQARLLRYCGIGLRDHLTASLNDFAIICAEQDGRDGTQKLKPSAVALTITDVGPGADLPGIAQPTSWSDESAVVLTRRSSKLRNHSGQWALPGGRLDEGESPEQTALRELKEEVGIKLDQNCILGRLDDFVTRSGYIMTPVVVWGGRLLETNLNPDEVASVHRIPLAEFVRSDAPMLSETNTSDAPILRMPVGDDHIAAPTAAILYQFREVCLCNRSTRVAHFEQPGFAWR